MGTINRSNRGEAQYAFCPPATLPVIDVHKALRQKDIAIEGRSIVVADANSSAGHSIGHSYLDWMEWLEPASKIYHTSSDPADYVFAPVPVCPTDLPNRNGVAFPLHELVSFDPDLHTIAYKGWKGCPTYSEHQNDNPVMARGMVIDSVLRPVTVYGGGRLYKVLALAAFDRTKYPEIAHGILTGEKNSYSMGAYIRSYTCSYCNAELGKCTHCNPKRARDFYLLNGKVVHRNCHGISPFELSEVADPAWGLATSDAPFHIGERT